MSGPATYALVVLYTLPGLFIGLVMHELTHAAVALRAGDPTPRRQGRMTLDPRRQVDPFGLTALLIAGFGWSRPASLSPLYLPHARQRAAVAVSGPLAHLAVAAVFALALRVDVAAGGLDLRGFDTLAQTGAEATVAGILLQGFFINIALFVFNALPLPGLDGYAVLRALLFGRAARLFLLLEVNRYAVYAAAVLVAVLPAELTHGAVNPLAAVTTGTATAVFSHVVEPGTVPLFLGLPNVFMLAG